MFHSLFYLVPLLFCFFVFFSKWDHNWWCVFKACRLQMIHYLQTESLILYRHWIINGYHIFSFDIICLKTTTVVSKYSHQLVFWALSGDFIRRAMDIVTLFDLRVSCPAFFTLSPTRYRNHFLCVASFHYTPDYSHSCPSPLHFLFPSFSSLSFLSF